MPVVKLPFANGFYQADSLPISGQEAINCYPVIHQAPALNEESLYATPGLAQLVADQGNGANRGAHVMAGIPYWVNGSKLYRMNRTTVSGSYSYTVTELGSITGSGRVWMASNNNDELCILVPGGKAYIFTEADSYGSDLVTNGDFATDTNWSKGSGWTISGGTASCDGTQATLSNLAQNISAVTGTTYRVTFTVSNHSAGSVQPVIAGDGNGTTVTTDGTYVENIVAGSIGTNLDLRADADFIGDIDDVSVEEVYPFTFSEITDSDFRANGDPQSMIFLDGYFVFTTENKHIISGINDGLSYNALDFGTAESSPDDIVAAFKHKNQLFVAGTETIEGFQNIGGADYPFQRTGVFLDKGMSAPFAGVNTSDAFVFMGKGKNESPAIWMYAGGTSAQKISTYAIDSILQDLTDTEISAVYAWAHSQKGAYFVGFTLPSTTIVYDTVTQRWHERKSYELDLNSQDQTAPYRVSSIVEAYGLVLVGDSEDGRIGYMDDDLFTEYGDGIIRQFTTMPFQNNMGAMFVPWIELTVESGVGDATTPDPQITMFRSKDGRTFSNGRTISMGKIGEYEKRCIWRRNGRVPRFESFRFRMSDPVKFVAIQLTAKVK